MDADEEMEHLYALMKAREIIAENVKQQRELKKQLDEKDAMGEPVLKEGTKERGMVEQALEDKINFAESFREQLSVEYNLKMQKYSTRLTERIKSIQERYPDYMQRITELGLNRHEITPLKDTIEAIRGQPNVGFTGNSGDFPEGPSKQARRMYADAARALREHEQTVSQYMQKRWDAQQTSHQRPNSPGRARFASDSSGGGVEKIYEKERELIQQEEAMKKEQEKGRGHNF